MTSILIAIFFIVILSRERGKKKPSHLLKYSEPLSNGHFGTSIPFIYVDRHLETILAVYLVFYEVHTTSVEVIIIFV